MINYAAERKMLYFITGIFIARLTRNQEIWQKTKKRKKKQTEKSPGDEKGEGRSSKEGKEGPCRHVIMSQGITCKEGPCRHVIMSQGITCVVGVRIWKSSVNPFIGLIYEKDQFIIFDSENCMYCFHFPISELEEIWRCIFVGSHRLQGVHFWD